MKESLLDCMLTNKEVTLVEEGVLAVFKTHTYPFANKFFLQRRGGPIGLRSSCCVARLVMMWWDDPFLEVMKKSNLEIIKGARYMDDVRIWLRAVRLGWRWMDRKLKYRSSWWIEEQEAGMSQLRKTSEVPEGIMNSVCSWLTLTMEHEEMFNGVLPTLDLIIWVSDTNKVMFSFYEKENGLPHIRGVPCRKG